MHLEPVRPQACLQVQQEFEGGRSHAPASALRILRTKVSGSALLLQRGGGYCIPQASGIHMRGADGFSQSQETLILEIML